MSRIYIAYLNLPPRLSIALKMMKAYYISRYRSTLCGIFMIEYIPVATRVTFNNRHSYTGIPATPWMGPNMHWKIIFGKFVVCCQPVQLVQSVRIRVNHG